MLMLRQSNWKVIRIAMLRILENENFGEDKLPVKLYFRSTTLYAKVYFVMHGLLSEMCIDTHVQSP